MIDFSLNVSATGPAPTLFALLDDYKKLLFTYPDHTNAKTLKIFSRFLKVPQRNIGLGIGSTQILFDIPHFLTYKRAVVIAPTFWQYTHFNLLSKKRIKKIILDPKRDFQIDFAALDKALRPGDALFLCNVNSPTSVMYDRNDLLELIKKHPEVQFVIDETYLLFRGDFSKNTLLKIAAKSSNVNVIFSLSKFFALPGLRVGILVGPQTVVEKYTKYFHIPYSISGMVPVLLDHILNHTNYVEMTREYYDHERKRFYDHMSTALQDKLSCHEPDGNFMICKILTDSSSVTLKKKLRKKGIIIRGGDELSGLGEKWIRFSILKPEENDLLVKELGQIL
jgi:threonine-phosphate decarboxylase